MDMLLFVYGTLKRGWWNNRLLQGAEFVGEDVAPGKLFAWKGEGIPIVMPNDGPEDCWVKGEVFRIADPRMLGRIDRLEGHPHAYTRMETTLRSGRVASVYYWLPAGGRYRSTEERVPGNPAVWPTPQNVTLPKGPWCCPKGELLRVTVCDDCREEAILRR